MPLLPSGDLVWHDDRARPGEPADPFATARVLLPAAVAPAGAAAGAAPGAHRRAGPARGLHGRRTTLLHARRRPPSDRVDARPAAGVRAAHRRRWSRRRRRASGCCAGTRAVVGCSRWPCGPTVEEEPRRVPRRRLGARSHRPEGGQGRGRRHGRRGRACCASGPGRLLRNDRATPARPRVPTNRRQVLYWRLLARLFDPEEQPALESASVAIVDDIGLPAGAARPVGVGRHHRAALPGAGRRVRRPDGRPEPAASPRTPTTPADAGGARCAGRRWSRSCCSTSSPPGRATSAPTQLARWQQDAGWFEQALGLRAGAAARPGRAGTTGLGDGARRARGRPGQAACSCARCWPTRRWPRS